MMKKRKVTSQMKGQDITPEKQLNEVKIGELPGIQSNDSEDDPGSQKRNGGKN